MPRTPDFEGDVSTCLAHGVAVKSLRMKDLARQQYLASSAAHTCRETQGGQCTERSYRAGLSSLLAPGTIVCLDCWPLPVQRESVGMLNRTGVTCRCWESCSLTQLVA